LVFRLPGKFKKFDGITISDKAKNKKRYLKRKKREWWRLTMFVCKNVEGTRYLTADFSLLCSGDRYETVIGWAVPAIIVYPIGIPMFIFYKLREYRYSKKIGHIKSSRGSFAKLKAFKLFPPEHLTRNRLGEKGIRAQLGFLYDCYNGEVWYFELVDMIHKLGATSLIAFFPWQYQLPMGMLMLMSYLAVLLCFNPYIRKGDDILHLVAQTELILILMAGNCFENAEIVDAELDWILSLTLIGMISLFCGWWLSSMWTVAKKWSRGSRSKFAKKCRKAFRIKDEKTIRNRKANGIVGSQFTLDRNDVTNQSQRLAMLTGHKHVNLEDEVVRREKTFAANGGNRRKSLFGGGGGRNKSIFGGKPKQKQPEKKDFTDLNNED